MTKENNLNINKEKAVDSNQKKNNSDIAEKNIGEEALFTEENLEIDKIIKQKNEYLNSLQRLQAEFDNYRKRNQSLSIKCREEGVLYVIKELLVVLDSFDSAKKNLTKKDFEGVHLIENQLLKVLENIGVKKIECKNNQFDPSLHNAILVEKDEEKKSGEILEVFQEGYKYKDNIVRHSVVKINE